jgi:DNA/RNA-binding protein KIN17
MIVVPQKIRHKACQGQQRLSGVYSRQTSLTHERQALGDAHVDETDKGWFIAWIDRSPKALEKQEASLKKERATMNDEQRERLLIAEQIERAEREAREKGEGTSAAGTIEGEESKQEEGLQREEAEKKVAL